MDTRFEHSDASALYSNNRLSLSPLGLPPPMWLLSQDSNPAAFRASVSEKRLGEGWPQVPTEGEDWCQWVGTDSSHGVSRGSAWDIGPHAASPRHVGDDSAWIRIHIPPLGNYVTMGELCAPSKSPSSFIKQGQY